MDTSSLIAAAVKHVGSEAKLGAKCGVSQAAISKAKRAGRVSARLAKAIESATGGLVQRWQLCPEIFDPPQPVAASGLDAVEHSI